MLFNSYEFIFFFLPLTLFVYFYLAARRPVRWALSWLVMASLVFYGWWNPAYLTLIVASVVFNFMLGRRLAAAASARGAAQRRLLVAGIAVNLGALAYFKYAGFLVDNLNELLGSEFHLQQVILPLAISFFTFQQITFLVDAFQGKTREHSFLRYCLFVTFFPQLIAGPIVHHGEMLPQFAHDRVGRFRHEYLAIGLTIFIIGLFKKVAIADTAATWSTPLFDAALLGFAPTFLEAWGAALAYTFQLYFDFSGYSDMAVGLAYAFGIRLTLNFFSPYKAVNIIDFWKRWHISLSRFLRDYVYVPLGGNRKGVVRRYHNLLLTMVLGGLWHGAGWTFIAWGAVHGALLVVNHLWRALRVRAGGDPSSDGRWGRLAGRTVTFLAVVAGWVIFRAESLPAALSILRGMAGGNGFALPPASLDDLNRVFGLGDWLALRGWEYSMSGQYSGGLVQAAFLCALLLWSWFAPNTHEFMGRHAPALGVPAKAPARCGQRPITWAPHPAHAVVIFLMLLVSVFLLDTTSEFLYFQF